MPSNKNILYIGPYREFSGAGNSSRRYIEALHQNGHDVCIAPIFYSGEIYPEQDISSEILPLEHNYLKSYDIVIQHCHPFDYCYSNKFEKNIGIFQFNAATLSPSITSRLKILDEIVVNSNFNKSIINSFRHNNQLNIKVFPELIDENLKNKNYVDYQWLPEKNKPLIFYTIGDMTNRKNIEKIILAFLYTFNKSDNVELLIKTKSHFSHDKENIIHKEMEYALNKCYRILRKNKKDLKNPKIMIGQFDYSSILSMHKNCNCYIDASKAENFGYPVLEAALFNNYIICNENSSTKEISDKSYLVSSIEEDVVDPDTPNFIYNRLGDQWYNVSFIDLCSKMGEVFRCFQSQENIEHNLDNYFYSKIDGLL